MHSFALPRTAGCLVCGRDNPHGLRLQLAVDDVTGVVSTEFVAQSRHAGFNDVVHGGLIATVADEAMAWAAAWAAGRFGLCAELTIRFRAPAIVGATVRVEASVDAVRSRLVTTRCRCVDDASNELSIGVAKYVPMSAEHHARVVTVFIDDAATRHAAERFLTKRAMK